MGIINFGVWVIVVLYMLYVIGYTYQFIEYHRREDSNGVKKTMVVLMLPIMFVLIPFLLGLVSCINLLREVVGSKEREE